MQTRFKVGAPNLAKSQVKTFHAVMHYAYACAQVTGQDKILARTSW